MGPSPTPLCKRLVVHHLPKAGRRKQEKGKQEQAKHRFCNAVSASSREVDSDVILYTESEDKEEEEIIYSAQAVVPIVAATRSGNPYHKNFNEGKVVTTSPFRTGRTIR